MAALHCLQLLVFSACVYLFALYIHVALYADSLLSSVIKIQPEYDYVIVGSGTSGAVVAHRLALTAQDSFVVLEAGGQGGTPGLRVPVLTPLLHASPYDWGYETVPQGSACRAMRDHKCRLAQGKIVGGSSRLNNMVHVRGDLGQYARWFQGTSSEEFLRHQFQLLEEEIIHLDQVRYESELTGAVLAAAEKLGYHQGFARSRVSQKNGRRWSTSDNAGVSENVLTHALVEKVIVEEGVARGVSFVRSGRRHTVYARKGVILSAGTYNTPKILQLSGFGPASVLNSLGIPVLRDLPVGENLQDHVTAGLDLILFDSSLSITAQDILNPINWFQYLFNGEGPLTSPGCEAIGFLSTRNGSAPDVQFMVLPVGVAADRGSHLRHALGLNDDVWYNYFATTFNKHSASILPIVLHPRSRGRVYINSTDTTKPPVIDPRYLSNEEDIDTLVDGLKFVKKLVETDSMRALGAHVNPLPFPGCEHRPMFSDSYWRCYVRHLATTSYHPVGTCSMGLSASKNTVVDTSFKVVGVERLYVCDASVLPALPSGNINAAVAMMASVFFDTIIVPRAEPGARELQVCYRNDLVFEYLFEICIIGVRSQMSEATLVELKREQFKKG